MNIAQLLAASARRLPARPAVIFDGAVVSYAELDARVSRLAAALRNMTAGPGSRVLLFQRNQPEMLDSLFACWRAGLIAVPVNSLSHPQEVAGIAADSDAEVIVYGPEFDEVARACAEGRPGLAPLCTAGDEYGRMVSEGETLPSEAVEPEHPAWLFYTSGTTGRPKGAVIAHRVLWAVALAYFADISPLGADDVLLHAAPLSHGSGAYALPGVAQGAAQVIQHTPRFDAGVALHLVERHGVTHIPFLTPIMVNRLVAAQRAAPENVDSLRDVIYSGAPMLAEDLKSAVETFGPRFTQVYGQAEALAITAFPAAEHVDPDGALVNQRRLASAGRPRVNVEVAILDAQGDPPPADAVGEICVRGPVVMNGYWRNEAATRAAMAGGWLRTGDLGSFDDHGYLSISGRSKEMIISGGINIYPREVEDVLVRHPAVAEVAVIGVPDRRWGESLRAVVVTRDPSVSGEQLVEHCRAHLASFKKPKSILFVDELPKTPSGKIAKAEVARIYGEQPSPA